ncbi:MAG: hypothetical protein A2X64_00775 [Ignavibacteria bacterium GWF2_33_9]|nr:MAG: hypothetical protein A2X64_00775 [Ignavibacteria bacterium GWF2_33_9]
MNEPKQLDKFDQRMIEWSMNDLFKRDCPICTEPKQTQIFIRPDLLNIYYCKNCSTFFISPAPSSDQIIAFYKNYESAYRAEFNIPKYLLKKTLMYTDPMSDLRLKELSRFMDFNGANCFDIGFGRARYLYLIKKLGGHPFGNEYNSDSIEIAKYLGINNVYHNDISFLNFNNFFDLVSMNDIIEHPLEPMILMENVVKMTKKGGLISVWTPNGSCGVNRHDNLTYRVDLEHMQYFTKDTFKYVAEKFNLEILQIIPSGKPILFGIENKITDWDRFKYASKNLIKYVPGFFPVYSVLKNGKNKKIDSFRAGDYNLFCIFRKK